MRFGKTPHAGDKTNGAHGHQRPVNSPPIKPRKNLPTHQRREHRRYSHDENQERKHADGFVCLEQIANNGTGDHLAGACSKGLKETKNDERIDGGRQSASSRRQYEEQQTHEQWLSPAEPISKRAVECLADRKTEEEGCQGELNVSRFDREFPRKRWQRRQIHVYGHWRKCGERSEEDNQFTVVTMRGRHGPAL